MWLVIDQRETVSSWRQYIAALLHESSLARTMPTDRILTDRCDYDTGRPRAVIRLRISQPRTASLLSVSNSLSGRHWELDQVPAVGDLTDIVQLGTGHHVSADEGQRRVAFQRHVAAHLVGGGQTPGATQRCLKPGCSERIGNSRRTGTDDVPPSSVALRFRVRGVTVLRSATSRLADWAGVSPPSPCFGRSSLGLAPPGFDEDLRMGQTREPVLIEALVAEPAVERFDIRVLVRLARLDQAQRDAARMRPCQHGARRCCTNRQWPARGQSTGSSPADAIRHWSAEGGHPIEDLTAENGLTPPARLDSGREGHRR